MSILDRLWVRLTIAFTLVILGSVSIIAILGSQQTEESFRQYVVHSELLVSGQALDTLEAYYQQNGSWEGVGSILQGGSLLLLAQQTPRNPWEPIDRRRKLDVILADAKGKVIYNSAGDRVQALSDRDISNAIQISNEDSGQTIGYLLMALPASDSLGPLEISFLTRMRQLLTAGLMVALVLGVVASALISLGLTAPLRRLAGAARAVASGDLGQRVPEHGTWEVRQVARDFNEMTSSLQQAEQLRQNMMADVAHELRTPLSVLQGNLRAILDDVYPLDKGEVALLFDETRILGRLVEDLHELALAEAGQLQMHKRETDLGALASAALARFQPAAESQSVALVGQIADDLPAIKADPDRLAQVLNNLLTNALRHTPAGGQITISVEAQPGHMDLAVRDDGEGIAPGDLEHVFDRFWRADRSRSRDSGGSGLGLAITRGLVEAHGGRIWAESALGEGARFTIRLPLAPAASPPASTQGG